MCGITGIVNLDKKPVKKDILVKMTRKLSHRGPDDEGFYIDGNIGLGHRRLSIIDLSAAGRQPMFYDNDNLTIVFNGEIYNYLEIRQELQREGFKFQSESDTEVILAAYKKWGVSCLGRFNGMWGFIIYEKKKNQLFVARDRLGVKPVYYYLDRQKIIFASEIKAILAHPEVKPKPNKKIIWDYLVTGWLDHSEETFLNGIKELRGGHYLIIQKECHAWRAKIKIQKYWDLKIQKISQDEQTNIAQFQNLFMDSVRLRLRADVPLGTCLSGGLDSSAIVMAINRYLEKEKIEQVGLWQKTFSAVYGSNYPCDERKFIREVTQKTGAKSYFVVPKGERLAREIKNLVWYQDLPFLTTSIYAQWNVFRLAHQKKIKVMLDGQGADELLAGYIGYFGINFMSLFKKKKFRQLVGEIYYFGRHHPPFWQNLGEILNSSLRAGWLGKRATKIFQKNNRAYQVFSADFLQSQAPPLRQQIYEDFFQNSLYWSLKMNLSALLRYEDRNSMAFAIESRVPFLDYRLVEFVFSLPNNYKIRQGETKWVMRQALKGLIPEKILARQDKIGFATPEEDWLRKGLKRELIACFSSPSFASRGFFKPKETLDLFGKFLDNKFQDSQLFWRLYCLEIWFRVFID